jgi:NADH-quinone oxidoreductase subunit H
MTFPQPTPELVATVVKALVVVGVLQGAVPILVWVERRGSALIQDRLGPNRVGPFGLLQAMADAVKFIMKEDIIPASADKLLYVLAPALTLLPALTTFSVVPFGPPLHFTWQGREVVIPMQVANVDAGVLVLLALVATGVYGIVIAGWASNNKYSLMGGIRSSAQIISYELAMGLAIVGVILPVGSLRLEKVVLYQQSHIWNVVPQILGFIAFFIAAFAETNRLPFDMPEAEAELVAGYHTEYSSMKFALFFMAEYANMVTSSALATTLYFGGWSIPFVDLSAGTPVHVLLGIGSFVTKVAFFLWFFVWVRWTLPRYRYDQLMRLGWKILLPIALVNLALVAILVTAGVL